MQLQILAVAVAMAALRAASALDELNCRKPCGNVTIEYPFGYVGCNYKAQFLVTCNQSTSGEPTLFLGPHTPNLSTSGLVISGMSIDKGELEILMLVASDCYNSSGFTHGFDSNFRLGGDIRVSTKNNFVAIGCDTDAYFRGVRGKMIDVIGCYSSCGKRSLFTNGSCDGVGCCEVAVPDDISSFNITVSSKNNHENITDFNPCSYGFFLRDGNFNFSTDYLGYFQSEKMPMLLEWAIGNLSCDIARIDTNTFQCTGKSQCDQNYTGPGYRCVCLEGFEGNPYVADGCKNINECSKNTHDCLHGCEDTTGNYTCKCPNGYSGDGRRRGTGCTADQSMVIKIVVGISSIGTLLLTGMSFALYKTIKKTKVKRRKQRCFKRNGGLLLKQQEATDIGLVDKTILFTSNELEKATDYFNENRVIGRGGQGTVYKGMLADGKIVAIKKSKVVDESQLEQFINEVVILSQVNHRNVVRLLGCCLETEVPLLVSEFIPNGTLYDLIQDENGEFPISLKMRLQIATEVAGAVSYLHSATSIPIYHRDIKTTNILMDEKYRAKVSDFGTSRLVSIDQTHLTTLVKGTFGYLDPEYFQSSQFTVKSDVYSFGVVLLELMTSEKPLSLTRFGENRSLATHFITAMEEGRVMSIFDAMVVKEGSRNELLALANLAMRCLNFSGKNRPTMKQVFIELEGIRLSHVASTVENNFAYGESTSTSTSTIFDHTPSQ